MDFGFTDEQAELAELSRRILTGRLTPDRLATLEAGGAAVDQPLWAELARAGVLSAALPEQAGGARLGLLGHCCVLAEIGRTVAPVPYLASIVLGAGAVARFGTPEQRRRWAEPAARGDLIMTAALAEDDSGDPRVPAVSARPVPGGSSPGGSSPGGWSLSGVKTAVPAGPAAGLLLVPASTPEGVAVFLATPGDDGVSVAPQQVTGGPGAGRVTLADARLPAGRMLGRPGSGPQIVDWLVSRATVGLCALQLGVCERALELTAGYARSRVQFGRPIGSFQAVAQRLADAYIDVEAIRLTMWQAAWLLSAGPDGDAAGPDGDAAAADGPDGSAGDPDGDAVAAHGDAAAAAVATAKFWAADAGHRVAHTAVHVHGGLGIDVSYPLHRYFTAASHHEFSLGGAIPQLRRIGAMMATRQLT